MDSSLPCSTSSTIVDLSAWAARLFPTVRRTPTLVARLPALSLAQSLVRTTLPEMHTFLLNSTTNTVTCGESEWPPEPSFPFSISQTCSADARALLMLCLYLAALASSLLGGSFTSRLPPLPSSDSRPLVLTSSTSSSSEPRTRTMPLPSLRDRPRLMKSLVPSRSRVLPIKRLSRTRPLPLSRSRLLCSHGRYGIT